MRDLVTLCFLFIILKLTNTIDWSWWYVFSPLIILYFVLLIIRIKYKFKGK